MVLLGFNNHVGFICFSYTFRLSDYHLIMQTIKPRKSLGQHFLKDKNIARKIVGSLKAEGCRSIVEVGAGAGILTEILLENSPVPAWFVEVDHNAVKLLTEKFPFIGQRIIHHDFLDIDLSSDFDSPLAVIGNLPYNISSPIFFKVLENRNIVREMVCMVQKEVAQRIASSSGNKNYGILSVLLQAYYNIEYLFTVKPEVFYPPPKVNSGVIRLLRNDVEYLPCNEALFFKVVKTAFNQRRKILKNSLKSLIADTSYTDPILMKRPEQLTVQDFVYITGRLCVEDIS